ncbi:DUF6221 family protein [Streptomyces sp. NPDC093060]|uniref:DUF6221 family protein n=1 Tax=Streptomyces sp. NPDC093060 TaxID=3366019 RepID=UPI0037F9DF94
MDDLARWLGEQLDEDERIARAAGHERVAPTPWHGESWNNAVLDGDGLVDAKGDGIAVVKGERVRDHLARHDPARVLREINAKRQIIAMWKAADEEAASDQRYAESYGSSPEGFPAGREDALEDVVRLLALPYADRPGYKEAWRP